MKYFVNQEMHFIFSTTTQQIPIDVIVHVWILCLSTELSVAYITNTSNKTVTVPYRCRSLHYLNSCGSITQ